MGHANDGAKLRARRKDVSYTSVYSNLSKRPCALGTRTVFVRALLFPFPRRSELLFGRLEMKPHDLRRRRHTRAPAAVTFDCAILVGRLVGAF